MTPTPSRTGTDQSAPWKPAVPSLGRRVFVGVVNYFMSNPAEEGQVPSMADDTAGHLDDDQPSEGSVDAVRDQLVGIFGPGVGEAAVARSVAMAVQAVRFFGDEPRSRGSLIERIARNELELLQEGRNERAWT